jgi:hypothetical protein
MPLRLAAALAAFAVCGGAHAAQTTNYMCTGYRPLAAELTPQAAQVHFEGKDFSLRRVHDNGEARYADRRGASIITKGRELNFLQGGKRLQCKLVSDALGAPKAPPSAASAAPPLSTSAPVAAK